MATLLKANIITADGGRFHAPVANLSPAGLFLRTTEDLHFGQRLTIHLLGFAIPGEVLFISKDPVGAVIAMAPPPGARPVIEVRAKTVEVVAAAGPAQPWEEDTAAEANAAPSVLVDDLLPSPIGQAVTDPGVDPWTVDEVGGGEKRESTAVPILDPEEHVDDVPIGSPEVPALESAPPQPLKVQLEVKLDPMLFASAALDDSSDLPPAEPAPLAPSAPAIAVAPAAPTPAPALIATPSPPPSLAPFPAPVVVPPPAAVTPAPAGLPAARPRGNSGISKPAARAATPLPWEAPGASIPKVPAAGSRPSSPAQVAGPPARSASAFASASSSTPVPAARANSSVSAGVSPLMPPPLPPPRGVSVSSRSGEAKPLSSAGLAPVLVPDPPKPVLTAPVLVPDPPRPVAAAPVLTPEPPRAPTPSPVLVPDPPKVMAAGPVLVPDPPSYAPDEVRAVDQPITDTGLEPLSSAIDDLSLGAPTPPPVDLTLPELEGDTVRFAAREHFQAQFRNNLMHGGLVVRAKPLAIGTQRLLALLVPGSDPYTVSARVIFHEPGKLGFMLDSFNLHKARLQQMAEPSAQPLA